MITVYEPGITERSTVAAVVYQGTNGNFRHVRKLEKKTLFLSFCEYVYCKRCKYCEYSVGILSVL